MIVKSMYKAHTWRSCDIWKQLCNFLEPGMIFIIKHNYTHTLWRHFWDNQLLYALRVSSRRCIPIIRHAALMAGINKDSERDWVTVFLHPNPVRPWWQSNDLTHTTETPTHSNNSTIQLVLSQIITVIRISKFFLRLGWNVQWHMQTHSFKRYY